MKMVNDLMPHHSISANNQELNSDQKLGYLLNAGQPKGDFKIFPEDLYDSECHNKYVDSLPTEVNNDFIIMESTEQEAGFDNLVETLAMCLSKTRADKDNKVQFSADENLSEHARSASQEHCRETDGNAIKDICTDKSVPVKEKILVEYIVEEGLKHTFEDIYLTTDEEFGSKNEKVDPEWPVLVGLKSSTDVACENDFNSYVSKVLIHQNGSKNDTKSLVLRDLLQQEDAETPSTENANADGLHLKTSKDGLDTAHKDSITECEVACGKLTSSSPTPEETADDSKVETSDVKIDPAREATNKFLHSTAANKHEEEFVSSVNHPQLPDATHMPQRRDPFKLASDHLKTSAPLQRDHFESSFASVGHSGSITYSGPIVHSGSLSHRSDASTASNRSFAFPVLQNEWNFSPVRMQKADRRHQRRHRGWMRGLFSCNF